MITDEFLLGYKIKMKVLFYERWLKIIKEEEDADI